MVIAHVIPTKFIRKGVLNMAETAIHSPSRAKTTVVSEMKPVQKPLVAAGLLAAVLLFAAILL